VEVKKTVLEGVILIEPRTFADSRGFFLETWNSRKYAETGLPDTEFVQDNHSRSQKNVVRGLHYQLEYPQGKLVYVVRGAVFDVVVDIRVGSPTFGQWFGCVLDDVTHKQIYIPPGFAHGFSVLSEEADFCYKCTNYYHPEDEFGILWNDPALSISWQLEGKPVISDKDRKYPPLKEVPAHLLPR